MEVGTVFAGSRLGAELAELPGLQLLLELLLNVGRIWVSKNARVVHGLPFVYIHFTYVGIVFGVLAVHG